MQNGFIVVGTNSGCGKTTITMALMHLFSKSGFRVAPFKAGPDYIDPAFHKIATATASHNLDSFLLDESRLKGLFTHYSQNADIAIVEGVMGLYDGLGHDGIGSTAELARKLKLPVILVVNCQAMYQSVAAIISGFMQYDPEIKFAGVILNHVYSDDQYAFLKEHIERNCGISCLGYLPPDKHLSLDSRHLGLIQASEVRNLQSKIERLSATLEKHLDITLTLAKSQYTEQKLRNKPTVKSLLKGISIAVAYDKSFCFYYQANLDLLTEAGAKLKYFSPLNDSCLPENVNALYLGGGYPEVFAEQLSLNTSLREQIKQAVENNLPVYAECGGLMYLTNEIATSNGSKFPMCGIFNCHTVMSPKLQNFGYCKVKWDQNETKAHEFHHSFLDVEIPNFTFEFDIEKAEPVRKWKGGLKYRNVLAGYTHIHFYSDFAFTEALFRHLSQRKND